MASKSTCVQGTSKKSSRLPGGVYPRCLEDKRQLKIILVVNILDCRGINCKDILRGLNFTGAVR